jgi:tight adherence protein B
MTTGFILILFFFVCAIVLTTVGLGLKFLEAERRKRVASVLKTASDERIVPESSILSEAEKKNSLDLMPLLSGLPFVKNIERYILQAGLTWPAGGVLVAMAISALVGVFLGLRVRVPVFREFAMVGLGCLLGAMPYLFLMFKRRKRLAEFEEQFPESLDFLARSMRAGHAFSVSLEMMSDEAPDPTGIEIRQVFNEQNLGAPIETALRNLAERVPLLDVRFFVSAVLMQRETGGNLAEILTKLSYVIRERFRLKGRVKAASAHGRITALILSVMPIITMVLLMIIAPQYLNSMAADEDGRYLIVGAITAQFLGYLWMKKIIKIKV